MTVERSSSKKFCQKCALQGIRSPIHLFQLNDEEALLMCKNVDCTFMPSSNWETLIVKRSISELSTSSSKKGSSSSLSSLTSSCNSDCGISSAQSKAPSKSAPQSRSSTPLLGQSSRATALPQKSFSTVTKVKSALPTQRSTVSPTPSLTDSSSGDKERKTLVPLAPFLCGHAHSFSSFETTKLEHRLKSVTKEQYIPNNRLQSGHKEIIVPVKRSKTPSELSKAPVGSKRRASSLSSDSNSSSNSSLNSRPSTPNPEQSCGIPAGTGEKKVRRIVVPSEILRNLQNGSLKLEIRKNKVTGQSTEVVFKPAVKVPHSAGHSHFPQQALAFDKASIGSTHTNSASKSSSGTSVSAPDTPSICTTNVRSQSSASNLEITPIGSIEDILKSQASLAGPVTFDLPSAANSDSIKSHIEAINSHLQAINEAIGRGSQCKPLELSELTSGFINQVDTTTTTGQLTVGNNLDTSVKNLTDCGNHDSFIPIGVLEAKSAATSSTLPSEGNLNSICHSINTDDVQSDFSESQFLSGETSLRSAELEEFFVDSFIDF